MDKHDEILIEILKTSLNNKEYTLTNNDNIEWDKLIKEAQEHKISSLVYYTLDRSVFDLIESDILKEWKKEVITSNLIELKHDKDIINIIDDFNKNNINYICLKGVYLKELYPKRELRTMSDTDILVSEKDYYNAKEILIKQGYVCEEDRNSIHEEFNKYGSIQVELHNALIDKDVVCIENKDFEEKIWNSIIEFQFNNIQTRILGKNDFLLHLLFHMVVHAKYMGFGLRQLYDLCLYIKYNKEKIDWIELYNKAYEYDILEFSKAIFYVVHEIFGVNVNENFIKNIKFSKKDINFLLENILKCGVYGKKELDNDFSFLYKNDNFHTEKQNISHNILKFMFPSADFMSKRYSYAKKCRLLIPIAWIHRMFFGGIIKNKTFYTIKNIKYSIDTRKNRNRIMEVFKLPK